MELAEQGWRTEIVTQPDGSTSSTTRTPRSLYSEQTASKSTWILVYNLLQYSSIFFANSASIKVSKKSDVVVWPLIKYCGKYIKMDAQQYSSYC